MSQAPEILIVDDEPLVQLSLARVLERAGHRVAACGSADEALMFLAQQPVAMVISDLHLGHRDGLALLAEVKERWPSTLRLVITGALDPELMEAIARCDVHRCIAKPWDNWALAKLVAQLFAAFGVRAQAHAG